MDRIVKSIKKIQTEPVYDITVEGEHHYILANGVITHNSGLKYSASSIIFLSKAKEKDGTEVIGNLITCRNYKSRFAKENAKVVTRLFYDGRGLDKYYGLLELGEKYGVFVKSGTRYEISGGRYYGKQILANPERFFTTEVMDKLNEASKKEFSYGEIEDLDETEITTEVD